MSALVNGHAVPQVGRGFAHALAVVGGGIGALLAEWQVRRETLALSELSDAALGDIGIGRGFEEEAVRHGRGFRRRPGAVAVASTVALPSSWTEWR